jgi:hypothetical protein
VWFLVVSTILNPQDADRLASSMAAMDYRTHAACMSAAVGRVSALASANVHGRYMCMRHGETNQELARAAKREF